MLKGLRDNPLFSVMAPEMNDGSLTTNWGSGQPPGGAGACLVLQKGAYYNATCEAERNFGCEEKKITSESPTTTKYGRSAFNQENNSTKQQLSYSAPTDDIFSNIENSRLQKT